MRQAVLRRVADSVLALPSQATVRVSIDGVDGAGKTMFADELRDVLVPSGRPVIRATVDGFHHPQPVRYRLGRSSPEGFYRDSYDYATLQRVLLGPLSPGGTGRFRRAVFDVDADAAVDAPEERAWPGSILLFDGIFLHRPELRGYWDYSVFLRVEWARNHRVRNQPVQAQHRYQEGQSIYLRECEPWRRASIVIDNDDLAAPFIVSSRSDVRIRAEQPGDQAAVRAVNLAAFETPAEASLVDALRARARPIVSLVAEEAGAIVGHIMFSPVVLPGHPALTLMGLAPMAVAPARQRGGIGSALVRPGLDECRRLGADGAVVLGHPDFYPRFGFAPGVRFGLGCEYDVPLETFMVLELRPDALRGAAGTVQYHAAFASL
ncbi:MAG: GNAT family N-acetyltransferase [Candidatus Rokuibacteriota bacterium]